MENGEVRKRTKKIKKTHTSFLGSFQDKHSPTPQPTEANGRVKDDNLMIYGIVPLDITVTLLCHYQIVVLIILFTLSLTD